MVRFTTQTHVAARREPKPKKNTHLMQPAHTSGKIDSLYDKGKDAEPVIDFKYDLSPISIVVQQERMRAR